MLSTFVNKFSLEYLLLDTVQYEPFTFIAFMIVANVFNRVFTFGLGLGSMCMHFDESFYHKKQIRTNS